MVEWTIDFLPNLTVLELGTNNRPFLADLVLYECVVETNLKFSLKIKKESLLKQLFTKMQLSNINDISKLQNITIFEQRCSVSIKRCKIHNS